jgi:PPIC-type PPIASE domain/SurA N-terminal domain
MNMKMPVAKVIMIALLASGTALSHAASTAATEPNSAVVATVNGHPITQDMLNDKLEQIYPSTSVHTKPGGSPALQQKALDAAIVDELVWQQAKKRAAVTPFAKAHLKMLQVRKACGPADFDAGLRMRGLTRDGYTRMLQRQMTIDAVNQKRAANPVKVSTAEARAYYDANRGRFHRPDRVHIRLILAEVAQNAKAEEEQAAKRKADDVYAKLKAGADFAALASQYSDDEYRFHGGDVGWMHKGSMDPEFEPLAFSLPVGEITAPFRTPPGYSIMRVEEREPAKDLTFEEVRDRLIKELTMQKSKKSERAWEESLKKNARIEINDAGQPAQATAAPAKSFTLAGTVPSH